jgi:uncharacterized protein YdhG (YjbR/CyaY superfamily)
MNKEIDTKKELSKLPYGAIKFKTIDEYHAHQPFELQEKLTEMRKIISEVAPRSIETISYNMPAFKQNKILVYYAGYKNHIGFYPTSKPIIEFKDALSSFKTSKGAIQFQLDKPLPKELIQEIVKFRMNEILAK